MVHISLIQLALVVAHFSAGEFASMVLMLLLAVIVMLVILHRAVNDVDAAVQTHRLVGFLVVVPVAWICHDVARVLV